MRRAEPREDHDDEVDTSDLTALVQEVIDRPGWQSGNSMGVFIDDPQTGTDTADWSFYAYDQTPAKAPQLHIEYTTSGGLSESASTTYIGGVYEHTVTDTDTTETSYYTLTGFVASRTDGVLEWIITDHLGSPNTTIHPSTGATTRRLHDPYGTERHDDGVATDRNFTGQLSDPSSGLLFYNARYYDNTTGRFISPDTIIPNPANPQDLNRYTYVRGNPASLTDPSGHCVPGTGGVGGVKVEDRSGDPCTNQIIGSCVDWGAGTRCSYLPDNTLVDAAVGNLDTVTPEDVIELISMLPVPFLSDGADLALCGNSVASGSAANTAIDCGSFLAPLLGAGWFRKALRAFSPSVSAGRLADDVSGAVGGARKPARNGRGHVFTIPHRNGEIVVRIMEEGGGRTNYYRVSRAGGEALTVAGEASSNRALTHIPISESSADDIVRLVRQLMGEG